MAKKSGGSVFVKAHTRNGKKVRAYTRSSSASSGTNNTKSKSSLRTFIDSRKGADALRTQVRSGSKDGRKAFVEGLLKRYEQRKAMENNK